MNMLLGILIYIIDMAYFPYRTVNIILRIEQGFSNCGRRKKFNAFSLVLGLKILLVKRQRSPPTHNYTAII